MKKIVVGLIAMVVMAGMAFADSQTFTYTGITNGVTTTNTVTCSGYIDKIEYTKSDITSTSTCTVATWGGSNGVDMADVYCTLIATSAKSYIARPRYLPTNTNGTALAAVSGDFQTNYSSVVSIPYERPIIGGNCLVKVTGAGGAASATHCASVVIYYQPLRK